MKFISSFLVLIFCISFAATRTLDTKKSSNIHAVIVAGAGGLENYFSQSNACRVYHLLRAQGIPAENIIHFAVDDIANNPDNPTPGKVLNEPNGTDVNAGCIKDYTGNDCSPQNFLKVLQGDKELAKQGKKVLQTGSDDHVFIYFNDHGDTGVIGFPFDPITSHDLNKALRYMHDHKMYGKLTFYLMTCESGSMFENILPANIDIYAVTSSKPNEPTWLSYCYLPNMPFCLSDEFTAAWMKNAETSDPSVETLEAQFLDILVTEESSTAQQYGTKSLASLTVSQFEGPSKSIERNFNGKREKIDKSQGLVDSRDAKLHYWHRRLEMANENERNAIQAKLDAIHEGRRFYDKAIRNLISEICRAGFCSNEDDVLSKRSSLVNHETYSAVVKKFHSSCINISANSYALKYLYVFVNIIESQSSQLDLQRFLFRLSRACAHHIGNHGFSAIV